MGEETELETCLTTGKLVLLEDIHQNISYIHPFPLHPNECGYVVYIKLIYLDRFLVLPLCTLQTWQRCIRISATREKKSLKPAAEAHAHRVCLVSVCRSGCVQHVLRIFIKIQLLNLSQVQLSPERIQCDRKVCVSSSRFRCYRPAGRTPGSTTRRRIT